MDLTGIRAIGIDEIHWQHGANFLTLVYQIDPTRKRLLWIGEHRRAKTLLRFFRWFGKERTAVLTFICSDMWKPYLKVVAKNLETAKVAWTPQSERTRMGDIWARALHEIYFQRMSAADALKKASNETDKVLKEAGIK